MFEQRSLSTLLERQIGGGTPPRSNPAFWNGPIPWASVKDFEDASLTLNSTAERISQSGLDASTANLIPAGTPLVCTRMAVGRCAITTQPVAINQDVRALTPKAEVQPRYLLRLLDFLRPAAESQAVGSTVKGIRTSDYLAIKVPVAPAIEQPVIARILDTLDTQIERTQALIAKLEQVQEGLLHDLLTRGVDENGELRPSAEEAPELYKASALGLIPREWAAKTLKDVSQASTIGPFGSDLVANDYRTVGVPVVFVRDIKVSGFEWNSRVYVTPEKSKALVSHSVMVGDVVLTKMGFPPCVATVYPKWMPSGVITADVIRLRINSAVAESRWVAAALNSHASSLQVQAITGGVTRPKVTLRDVRSLVIAVPPLPEQSQILAAYDRLIARGAAENLTLHSLRQAKSGLMDDLLTGRVRVTPLLDPQETSITV